MRELQKKEHLRRAIYSIPSLILLATIAFVLAKGAVKIVITEEASRVRAEALREQASAMAAREEVLRKNIVRLNTPEGVEEEIKAKFNVVPEGEKVAIIVDDKRSATSTDILEPPWYKRLLNAIIRNK